METRNGAATKAALTAASDFLDRQVSGTRVLDVKWFCRPGCVVTVHDMFAPATDVEVLSAWPKAPDVPISSKEYLEKHKRKTKT